MTYTRFAPWLDNRTILSPVFDDFLNETIDKLIENSGKANRRDAVESRKVALSVISANILRQCYVHPSIGLRIDLSNDGYSEGQFNPNKLGIRAIRDVIGYLENHVPPLITKRGGNYDREIGIGHVTQIWGTDEMIDLLFLYVNKVTERGNTDIDRNQPITRNTFNYTEYMAMYESMFASMDVPLIRLRNTSAKDNGTFATFKPTRETSRMESTLSEINDFIERRNVCDLFIPDSDFDRLRNEPQRNSSDFDEPESASVPLDLISRRKLYRVFNDGTFDHGGRFYGGWWQNIPSDYRRFITINDTPTIEIDFSNMQPAILYAQIGQQLVGDAYAVEGIDPSFRPLIKTTILQLINGKERVKAPRKTELPENMTWNDLREAVRERHKPIARYFSSGEGIRLQRLDSDIAETVLVAMMGKGILALPVHDSFIVAEGHQDSLRETMLCAYQRKMAGKSIETKMAPTLIDELLAGKDGHLSSSERHSLGMKLFTPRGRNPIMQAIDSGKQY